MISRQQVLPLHQPTLATSTPDSRNKNAAPALMSAPSGPRAPSAVVAQLASDFGKRPGALVPTALVQEAEATLSTIGPSVGPVLRLLDACGVAPDELHSELVSAGASQLRGTLGQAEPGYPDSLIPHS